MKYAEINKRYTNILSHYISNGYTVNTATMGNTMGDIAHIDLTNGSEIIRILLDNFHEFSNISLDGVEIVVGLAVDAVNPNGFAREIILNSQLEIIRKEKFYQVGIDYSKEKFYGTKKEAVKANKIYIEQN